MTYAELMLAAEAKREEVELQHQLLAWHAANTMNVHLKRGKGVTPAKLLGKEKRVVRFQRGEEGREKFLARMRETKRKELKREAMRDGD